MSIKRQNHPTRQMRCTKMYVCSLLEMVKQKTKKFKGILFGKFNLVCEFFPRRQAFDQYSIAFKTMFSPLHDTSN